MQPGPPGPLYSPKVIRELLSRHGLYTDKAFGQNFLVSKGVLDSIVEAAAIGPKDTVLEVGPGLGVLTRELASKAGRVISVELDKRLLPVLAETVAEPHVEFVQGDGLSFDFSGLPPQSLLVANLPYNVGTPIVVRALQSGRFKRIIVMLQKEVAERLCADPGSRSYGALSLIAAYYGAAKRVRDVKPTAFFPPPAVMSSVVRIGTHETQDPEGLFDFIHVAFKHRRKTLRKNLIMAGLGKEKVEAALNAAGLEPKLRAEALSLADFTELYAQLKGLLSFTP